MTTRVIVLNGGSSSGKSGIARCLQAVLPEPWLAFGTDTFGDALPAAGAASGAVIEFAPDGAVLLSPRFRALEATWITGLAAMARAGARIILDEVFLGGASSQRRWQEALAGLVHQGVAYDLEVDTTRAEALDCARLIAARAG